jgi:hypothetical protein
MSDLYALDEALDYLNGTNCCTVDIALESMIDEIENFDIMTEGLKEIGANIKEAIRRLILKVKQVITKLKGKIKGLTIEALSAKLYKEATIQLKAVNSGKYDEDDTITAPAAMLSCLLADSIDSDAISNLEYLKDAFEDQKDDEDFKKLKVIFSVASKQPSILYKLVLTILQKKKHHADVVFGRGNPNSGRISVSEYKEVLENIIAITKEMPFFYSSLLKDYDTTLKGLDKLYKNASNVEEKAKINDEVKAYTKTIKIYNNIVSAVFKILGACFRVVNKDGNLVQDEFNKEGSNPHRTRKSKYEDDFEDSIDGLFDDDEY